MAAKAVKRKRKSTKRVRLPWGVSAWSPIDWDHREVDESRCRASVHAPEGRPEGSYYFWQCSRKAKHTEHGLGWCSTHLPSKVGERRLLADDRDIARREVRDAKAAVGRAYIDKRRWGKGPVAAAKAAAAAYRRLEKAERVLRKLDPRA